MIFAPQFRVQRMKKAIVLTSCLVAYSLNAQSIGNSPYAAYGIGDVKYDNSVDISSMGGISAAYINDFNGKFNFDNPATNQNYGLTSLSIEGTNENNYFSSNYGDISTKKHSTYLSNIAFAFPITKKLKFGLGYQPYSSKGYTIVHREGASTSHYKLNKFSGSGTVSLVQGAVSYTINPNFSLGFKANYHFGKLTDLEEISYSDAVLINGYSTTNTIKSFNFTTGAVYQKKLKNDRKLTFGATYTFGSTGKSSVDYTNSTYYYLSSNEKMNETILDQKTSTGNNYLPQRATFGVGYGNDAKWFASTQFDYKSGNDVQFMGKPFHYEDSYKISAGGWYLPNYNNFRNYFSRVIYRFGAYYERGGLKLNPSNQGSGNFINEFAVTAGASFPFADANINKRSSLDIGIELGKRGTTQNNLINQTFINLKIGLNFSDLWFRKVEFD